MQGSDRLKSIFKVIAALLLFILFTIIFTLLIISPILKKGSIYNSIGERNELAGTIDCLYTGASGCNWGINPKVVDEITGYNSFNLSAPSATVYGMRAMTEQEIECNPVHTVILEVSGDTLSRNYDEEASSGEGYTLIQLRGLAAKLDYARNNISFFDNEYEQVYLNLLQTAFAEWKNGAFEDTPMYRGYRMMESNDICEDIREASDEGTEYREAFREDNVNGLVSFINYLKEKNIRVIVIVMPEPISRLAYTEGLDEFNDALSRICEDCDCEYYNFDLYRDRDEYIKDTDGYFDNGHLSEKGAEGFGIMLGNTIVNPSSSEFYDSYDELIDYEKENMTYGYND